MNMKKLLLFFIISVTFLPCVLTPNSKIIADLELALEDAAHSFKPDEILIAADGLLRYKPKSAKANFEKARALAKLGKDAEALVLYKLAIRYGYKHLGSLYNDMGESLEKLGRLEEALESYDMSIKHGWLIYWVYFDRDRVLMKLGKLGPNAQKIIDLETQFLKTQRFEWEKRALLAGELLKYKPLCGPVHYEKAEALSQLGRYSEAIASYDLAIKYGCICLGDVYFSRGGSLEELGRLEEALESYNLAIWHGLDDKWVCYAKAGVLWKLGRFEKVHKLVTPIQFIYYIYHIALKHLY